MSAEGKACSESWPPGGRVGLLAVPPPRPVADHQAVPTAPDKERLTEAWKPVEHRLWAGRKRSGRPGPAAPVPSGHDGDLGCWALGDPRGPPVCQGRLARTPMTCVVPVALTHREGVWRLHTQGPGA